MSISRKRNGEYLKCKCCSKEFYVPRYRVDKAVFCSKECQNRGQYISIPVVCKGCNVEFFVSESRKDRKFCSIECKNTVQNYEKIRRVKIKALNKLKRGSNSSRSLKNLIGKVRDLYCDNCGYNKHNYNLDIHHIDEDCTNNKIDNLGVLCAICHRDLHYGGLIYKNGKYYDK